MRTRKILLLTLAGAFGVISGSAGLLAYQEHTAFRAGSKWSVPRFQEYQGEALGLSHLSNQYWLNGCLGAVTSIKGRLLYGEDREKLLDNCWRVTEAITEASPRDAYAWYFLAYLADQKNADETFNAALQKSYESGPTEQWIAELRVPLAERGRQSLNAAALEGHQKDLGLLVESQRGIGSIARRYVRDPAFRNRITDVVETLPQTAQQRFLGTLKSEVARFQVDQ